MKYDLINYKSSRQHNHLICKNVDKSGQNDAQRYKQFVQLVLLFGGYNLVLSMYDVYSRPRSDIQHNCVPVKWQLASY
jgi:hypothetical protein